jgi:UDP-N-acetylmuramate--alanine ligase
MIILNHKRHIHFIGIGGVGMSGLAEIVLSLGFSVSGSDHQSSSITERLISLGIDIQYDHQARFVTKADIIVYSSAIRSDNEEIAYARNYGITIMRRAEMLGELMRMHFSIGVAGTHGKTTTTSFIGHILNDAGMQPTVIVGGILNQNNSNAIMGKGSILVAEADEYDRSFLRMYPALAVVTNIEADHLDCYADIDDIKNTFLLYMHRVPFYGAVLACIDDANVREVIPSCERPVIRYGLDKNADYQIQNVRNVSGQTQFSLFCHGEYIIDVTIPVPGLHNVRNACAACAVALELGIDAKIIVDSLTRFSGVKRRFEIIGRKAGITVIDDYAHHPSEIKATLAAARSAGYLRIVAVFQPHLYTRTRDFMDDFAAVLCMADKVIVTGIYKSREEPIPGVTAELIVITARKQGCTDIRFVENKNDIADSVVPELREGDAVIVMGAGDIWQICPEILAGLNNA